MTKAKIPTITDPELLYPIERPSNALDWYGERTRLVDLSTIPGVTGLKGLLVLCYAGLHQESGAARLSYGINSVIRRDNGELLRVELDTYAYGHGKEAEAKRADTARLFSFTYRNKPLPAIVSGSTLQRDHNGTLSLHNLGGAFSDAQVKALLDALAGVVELLDHDQEAINEYQDRILATRKKNVEAELETLANRMMVLQDERVRLARSVMTDAGDFSRAVPLSKLLGDPLEYVDDPTLPWPERRAAEEAVDDHNGSLRVRLAALMLPGAVLTLDGKLWRYSMVGERDTMVVLQHGKLFHEMFPSKQEQVRLWPRLALYRNVLPQDGK